jgi:CO dehydrogenase nickel-insertion accessory protein CooC1
MAFHTLNRIIAISQEVKLNFEHYWVLGNRFSENKLHLFIQKFKTVSEKNIKLLGFIPEDLDLMKYNLLGKNLLNLPNDNIAYNRVKNIFKNII